MYAICIKNGEVLLPRSVVLGCEELLHSCLQEIDRILGMGKMLKSISFSTAMNRSAPSLFYHKVMSL